MAELDPEIAPIIQALIEMGLGWMVPEILTGIDDIDWSLNNNIPWYFESRPIIEAVKIQRSSYQKVWVAEYIYQRVKEVMALSRASLNQLDGLRSYDHHNSTLTEFRPTTFVLKFENQINELTLDRLFNSNLELENLRQSFDSWLNNPQES